MIIGRGEKIHFKKPVERQVDGKAVKMEFIGDSFCFGIRRKKKLGLNIPNFHWLKIKEITRLGKWNYYKMDATYADLLIFNETRVIETFFAKKKPFVIRDIEISFSFAPCPQIGGPGIITLKTSVAKTALLCLSKKMPIKPLKYTILSYCGEYFYNNTLVELMGNYIKLGDQTFWKSTPLMDFYTASIMDKCYMVICLKGNTTCPDIFNFKNSCIYLGNDGYIFKYLLNVEPENIFFYGSYEGALTN